MYYSLHLYAICFKEYMYRFITRLACNVLGEVEVYITPKNFIPSPAGERMKFFGFYICNAEPRND